MEDTYRNPGQNDIRLTEEERSAVERMMIMCRTCSLAKPKKTTDCRLRKGMVERWPMAIKVAVNYEKKSRMCEAYKMKE